MAEPPRVPPELFRFATTERADLHIAVLHAFAEAAGRLETALTPAALRALLPPEAGGERDVAAALRRLTAWGLLDVVFDHTGGFGTAEAYRRESPQYALTRRGEAALAALRHATAALPSSERSSGMSSETSSGASSGASSGGTAEMSSGASSESFSGSPSGALHTAVLDAVADRLRELDDLLRDADPGRDRRVFTALRELECHFDGLRADAGRFTAELRRLLRPGTPAPDGPPAGAAVTYLQETVTYLQEYATGLDQRWDAIKQALESVARHGVNVLHTRALAGANLPPSRAEVSSSRGGLAPSPSLPGQDPVAAWLEERAVRWEALRAWFAEDGGARRLHDVAREAVVALLESLDRIADARRRPAGAAADFRALARWFATAPTEDDAHRLWDAAFGLAPARHAHLGHADAELVPAGVPWARAEPVEVSALLRSRGRTERVGRTGKVRDVTALRAERRARAARERAALETAWSSLATTISGATPAHGGGRTSAGPGEPAASGTGAMRLSRLGELDHAGLARLLDLIGRALAERPDAAGFRRAATPDGRIEIVLRDPEDGAVAELRTPEGSFLGPDYLIDLHAAGGHGCETAPAPHSRAVGA